MNKVKPLVLALLVWLAGAGLSRADKPEVRALWVTSQQLINPDRIARLVAYAVKYNFNMLFLQARRGGEVYYRSELEPPAAALAFQEDNPANFDPLAYALELTTGKNISVQAWLNIYYLGTPQEFPLNGNGQEEPAHVRLRFPEWLINLDKSKAESEKNGLLYLSPSQESVSRHVLALCEEIISRYRVDGLHLDYIRYPNEQAGLTAENRLAFQRRFGLEPEEFIKEPAVFIAKFGYDRYAELKRSWREICADPITRLVRQVHDLVKAHQPGLLVSAAVVPDQDKAQNYYYQDWPAWLEQGLVDLIVPMCYSANTEQVSRQAREAAGLAARVSPAAGVVIGLGAWRLTPQQVLAKTVLIRGFRLLPETASIMGVCYFSYDKMFPNTNYGEILKKGAFTSPVPLPAGLRRENQYAGTL